MPLLRDHREEARTAETDESGVRVCVAEIMDKADTRAFVRIHIMQMKWASCSCGPGRKYQAPGGQGRHRLNGPNGPPHPMGHLLG